MRSGVSIGDRYRGEVATGEVDVVCVCVDEDQCQVPFVIPVPVVVCAVLAVSKVECLHIASGAGSPDLRVP